jgi:hypothetical protein
MLSDIFCRPNQQPPRTPPLLIAHLIAMRCSNKHCDHIPYQSSIPLSLRLREKEGYETGGVEKRGEGGRFCVNRMKGTNRRSPRTL